MAEGVIFGTKLFDIKREYSVSFDKEAVVNELVSV